MPAGFLFNGALGSRGPGGLVTREGRTGLAVAAAEREDEALQTLRAALLRGRWLGRRVFRDAELVAFGVG